MEMDKTNKIRGGKADGMSVEDIARKHNVFVGTIKKQIEMGIKIEKEHTHDEKKAREIAMDHLTELPDYYTRLNKMEKSGEKSLKKKDTKEQMDASASGSYEAPLSNPITRPISRVHEMTKKEFTEQMGSGISAGAMYDGPIGTAGPSSPMDKTKKRRKDPLKIDNAESTMGGASITGASTKDMIATKKGFPRFGGPGAKFVEIDNKCKTFPYCDQGASSDRAFKGRPNPIKLKEIRELQKSIQEVSQEYQIPAEIVAEMVVNQILSEGVPSHMFDKSNLDALATWGAPKKVRKYRITVPDGFDIVVPDNDLFSAVKLFFYKNDIKFDTEEI
jgi:hypothetical protein